MQQPQQQQPLQDQPQMSPPHDDVQPSHESAESSSDSSSESTASEACRHITEAEVDPTLLVVDLPTLHRTRSPRTYAQMEAIIRAREIQRRLRDEDTDSDYEEEQPAPKRIRVRSSIGASS